MYNKNPMPSDGDDDLHIYEDRTSFRVYRHP